jgi:hypothetical protein
MMRTSLDSILKGFNKTVAQLDQLVAFNDGRVAASEAVVAKTLDEIADLRLESSAAVAVRTNIFKLLSVA